MKNEQNQNYGTTHYEKARITKSKQFAYVDHIFQNLSATYAQRFTSAYPVDVIAGVKDIWRQTLFVNDPVNPDMIKPALLKCPKLFKPWPPNLVEFKDLCQPNVAVLGLPSLDIAFLEITMEREKPFSHGMVLALCRDKRITSANLPQLPRSQGLKIFKPVYAEYVERVQKGVIFDNVKMIGDSLADKSIRAFDKQRIAFEKKQRSQSNGN